MISIKQKSTHALYLLNELNASEEIESKINEDPINTFTLVLFLLKYKHVMVEELLKLLVGEVDAKLLKAVVLKSE